MAKISVPKSNEHWQTAMTSATATMKHLFTSKELSDASFDVLGDKDQSEVIQVHRLVLAMRSTVFEAMFYGPMANTKMPIAVDDIKTAIFKTMLQFLYTDDAACVTPSNALDLLYAAHKYDITSLRELCSTVASAGLTVDLVFPRLSKGIMFDAKKLVAACYDFIDSNTTAALSSKHFVDQPASVVKAILQRPTLAKDGMPEACIYGAVTRWAAVEASRKSLPMKPDRARDALGDLLYLIRFPLMTAVEITNARSVGILTAEEKGDLLSLLLKVPEVRTRFITEERTCRPKVASAHTVRLGQRQKPCGSCHGSGVTQSGANLFSGHGYGYSFATQCCAICQGQGYVSASRVTCESCKGSHQAHDPY